MQKPLIVFACFVAFVAAAGQEQIYKGHTFSEWVSQIDAEIPIEVGHEPEYVSAIHYFGTNEIPALIQWIKNDSTALQAKKEAEAQKKNLFLIGPASYSSSERAILVFGILNDEARPAISELTQIAMTSKDRVQFDAAIESLARIGPDSLPSFNIIFTKGPPDARFSALGWLAVFHTNALEVLPAAIKCLVGKNDEVGDKAADELSRLDVPPAVLIPALTNAFQSASIAARLRIVRCVYWIGSMGNGNDAVKNYGALPIFRSALNDSNPDTRNIAKQALLQFAPEMLTNGPAQ